MAKFAEWETGHTIALVPNMPRVEKTNSEYKQQEISIKNRATQWHNNRSKLLQREQIPTLLKQSKNRTLISIVTVPIFHFTLCYWSMHLSFWQVIALAYLPGSVVFMYLFSNAHEIFHGVLGRMLGPRRFRNSFLRFATMTDISSALYLYYKYGHFPHHFDQGSHNVKDLNQLYITPSMDMDPTTNFKNIYKFKLASETEAQYRFPSIEYNRLTRFFCIFLMPLFDSVNELLVEPVKLAKWFQFKNAPFSRHAIEDALIQGLLIITILLAMGFWFESWNHLIYVFFCRVFFLGFLHPYGILWATIHSSVDEGGKYQPSTSIHGRFATFLCAGINLHTEHHDALWLSRSSLPKLQKAAPAFYKDLKIFSGFLDAARFLFQKHYHNVYSP